MAAKETTDKGTDTGRRNFLGLAGIGAAAGAAVAVAGKPKDAAAAAPTRKSAGYRETEHVKTAYKLARF